MCYYLRGRRKANKIWYLLASISGWNDFLTRLIVFCIELDLLPYSFNLSLFGHKLGK